MVGTAVFVYGLLMSFIFSSASRNAKLDRKDPAVIVYLGYVLVGLTAGGSLALLIQALSEMIGLPLLDLLR